MVSSQQNVYEPYNSLKLLQPKTKVPIYSVQLLSCVQLFVTPWIVERQASLSITNSRSLLKLMSSNWGCHPTISSFVVPFSSCLQSCPASVQFSSVAQSCLTLCDPMNCSTPGLPVHHNSQSPPRPMSIVSVMPSNYLILSSSVVPFSSALNLSQHQGLFK